VHLRRRVAHALLRAVFALVRTLPLAENADKTKPRRQSAFIRGQLCFGPLLQPHGTDRWRTALPADLYPLAAIYINIAEHPSRLECGTAAAATVFGPSYRRAAVVPSTLRAIMPTNQSSYSLYKKRRASETRHPSTNPCYEPLSTVRTTHVDLKS
jgi:hypothetical protein